MNSFAVLFLLNIVYFQLIKLKNWLKSTRVHFQHFFDKILFIFN